MRRRPPGRSAQGPSGREAELEALLAVRDARIAEPDRQQSEALDQQTATAGVLAAISRSPADLQAVLDTIVRSAARFCGGHAALFRVEGDTFRSVAGTGSAVTLDAPGEVNPLSRDRSAVGRAMIDGQAVHVRDLAAVPVDELPAPAPRRAGARTILAVPLPGQGVGAGAIGAIGLIRFEARPFTEGEIALVRTFADQAVI